jgi:integrase
LCENNGEIELIFRREKISMRQQFILFKRAGIFYYEDRVQKKQFSLRTEDRAEAVLLLNAKNEAVRQPNLNLQLARTYLSASDGEAFTRTWQHVMDEMSSHGKAPTKKRCASAMKSKDFDPIRCLALIQTKPTDFLAILEDCRVSVIHYLRRLHNLAFGLGWIPAPVLYPKQWPVPKYGEKRGIKAEEQAKILASEKNVERGLYYRLLWEIGASQSDGAALSHKNVDWLSGKLRYNRMKNGKLAQVAIGQNLKALLKLLPQSGPFFPKISRSSDNARASEFSRRCRLCGVEGVTLHSYRYAWAERAKAAGYPERFAMENLGHDSKAVHRAYAKGGDVVVPALEDFERLAQTRLSNVVGLEQAEAA